MSEYPNPMLNPDFLKEIPKTDIHVHLDGSVRISTLIELAIERNITLPSYDEDELRRTVFSGGYDDLDHYLCGFQYTVGVMQDAAAVERIAYEFAVDNYSEGVRYFEVRFAPQLHASITPSDNFNISEVIVSVNNGLERARNEFNKKLVDENRIEPFYEYGIIICAMRAIFPGMSRYYDALFALYVDAESEVVVTLASEILIKNVIKCKSEYKLPIVAIDIAGSESGNKAKNHIKSFDLAHEYLLNKTVHAGEGFGPESISQALRDLHAERIGHGFHLFNEDLLLDPKSKNDPDYIPRLVKYICDRRICVEVCLTSNLDTMPGLELKDHTFKKLLANNFSISLNTDNRLMSNTNTINELKIAIETFHLTPKQLREIVITGVKRSFYHGTYCERRAYVRSILDYYDVIAAKYGVVVPPQAAFLTRSASMPGYPFLSRNNKMCD